MIKIVIRVKYPKISYITPYKLSEYFTSASKQDRLSIVNENFKNLRRWTDAKRNYNSK